MRIDKVKFYNNTCKKCIKHEDCKGKNMFTCARMRVVNRDAFERMTKGDKLNDK